jgi:hypothetical protein
MSYEKYHDFQLQNNKQRRINRPDIKKENKITL